MKGHRFYEILEAHKKGEDLSVFVPTNPAEAALLADLQGGKPSNVIVSAHRPVPNTGVVEKVYLNTLLTKEEIIEIVSQLTYTPNASRGLDTYFVFREEGGIGQTWAVYRKDGEYAIANATEGVCFFASSIDVNINSEPYNNFEGFEPGIEGSDKNLAINGNVVSTHYSGASVGTENDKLAKLFSIDPFVIATPVPNSGYVDKIYFETYLNRSDMWEYIANDLYGIDDNPSEDASGGYCMLRTKDDSHIIILKTFYNNQMMIKDIATDTLLFNYGYYGGSTFGNGWNPDIDFASGYDINAEVSDTFVQNDVACAVGDKNSTSKLQYYCEVRSYPSDEVTPISGDYNGETLTVNANGEIDVKELLSNKKLPLKIVVNVNE